MKIKDVVAAFQKEKQEAVASRFPCRAIMVKNIKQYCELLSELKKISDIHIVQTSELFANSDVMPRFENLMNSKNHDKWIVLTGISEYLRLFSKKEINDRRFASLWCYQAPATNTGRIIIPLWGCEAQWFDKELNLNGDERQKDFYYDCSDENEPEQKMNLLVLSGMFEQYVGKLKIINGDLKVSLQEWFDYWRDPLPDSQEFVLLTTRCNNIAATNSNVSIDVVKDVLTFIKKYMHGADVLTRDNCTDDMQSILFDFALKGESLDDALLSILNVATFSGVDIMSKWSNLPLSYKNFVALWLHIHPEDTYTGHCFRYAKNVAEIPELIMLEIFKMRLDKPEWINEYHQLVNAMGLTPDKRFFKELDMIPEYETRLLFLTGRTKEERIYLIRMVGKWMRIDYTQVISSTKLQETYPELFAYLGHTHKENYELMEYMARYKAYKLENSLPTDEDVYFNGIDPDIYDNRYSVLSANIDDETVVLWIDAMGIEWLPLLNWTITQNCDGTIVCTDIVQANLPTETCFNNIWQDMDTPYVKYDKLDKLAHKGVIDEPDYYTCIEEQLSFIVEIHKKISDLLKEHRRVIVTGDHGTSRLAARFFHAREGENVPKNAIVYSHGRYCELTQDMSYAMTNIKLIKHSDGTRYAVYSNYDHFKQSGFAAGSSDENAIYGEVHGGATPEEVLVPIIVIDSNNDIPLRAEWENHCVKIAMRKAKLMLTFNKPVHQLQVKVAEIDGVVTPIGDKTKWSIVLSGIKPGTYPIHVCANNMIVMMPDITIRSAIGGEGDLP